MIDDALIGIEWEPQLTLLEFPKQPIYVIKKGSLERWEYFKIVPITYTEDSVFSINTVCMEGDVSSSVFLSIDEEYVPFYYVSCNTPKYLVVDDAVSNIEIRTRPVKLEILKDHIEFCTNYLSHFVKDLSAHSKGVGAFLPVSGLIPGTWGGYDFSPTKHVSISFMNSPGYLKTFRDSESALRQWVNGILLQLTNFRSLITVKTSTTVPGGLRLHVTVPYNFTQYSELVDLSYNIWCAKSEDVFKDCITDLIKYLDSWYSMNKQKKTILVCHTTGSKVKIINKLF